MSREVTLKIGNDRLGGRIFYPAALKDKNPAVLFLHGWTSGQNRYFEQAENLNTLGMICLTFDLRGHGDSDGDIKTQTRREFLDDALAAYDFLMADKKVDPANITVIGSSFGSYLAVLMTSRREVKNLVLRVPANYPDGDPNEPQFKYSNQVEILKWRYEVKSPRDTAALTALHNFSGNVLVVESGEDEIIPHQTIQNYVSAVKDRLNLKYVLMDGAPHSLTDHPELKKKFNKIVYDWLKSKLRPVDKK